MCDKSFLKKDKVTIIIPSYDRFDFLNNAIKSVKEQTYRNVEIIIINDGSTDERYKTINIDGVKVLHQEKNSRILFGFPNINYIRNIGIKHSTGEYIAFLDDDDYWLPRKLELQMKYMKENNCKMSSTEGYIGNGVYDNNNTYKKYLSENFYDGLVVKYKNNGDICYFKNNDFPDIWTLDFIKIHNCFVTSSVIFKKDLINDVGMMPEVKPPTEDHKMWLKLLTKTNSMYVKEPCFYYDNNHGYGKNYE